MVLKYFDLGDFMSTVTFSVIESNLLHGSLYPASLGTIVALLQCLMKVDSIADGQLIH